MNKCVSDALGGDEEEGQVQALDEVGEGEAARVWVVAVPPVESLGACAQWSSCFSWFAKSQLL